MSSGLAIVSLYLAAMFYFLGDHPGIGMTHDAVTQTVTFFLIIAVFFGSLWLDTDNVPAGYVEVKKDDNV